MQSRKVGHILEDPSPRAQNGVQLGDHLEEQSTLIANPLPVASMRERLAGKAHANEGCTGVLQITHGGSLTKVGTAHVGRPPQVLVGAKDLRIDVNCRLDAHA
eukprot:3294298-Prorocentrum_lima.AAC.1